MVGNVILIAFLRANRVQSRTNVMRQSSIHEIFIGISLFADGLSVKWVLNLITIRWTDNISQFKLTSTQPQGYIRCIMYIVLCSNKFHSVFVDALVYTPPITVIHNFWVEFLSIELDCEHKRKHRPHRHVLNINYTRFSYVLAALHIKSCFKKKKEKKKKAWVHIVHFKCSWQSCCPNVSHKITCFK